MSYCLALKNFEGERLVLHKNYHDKFYGFPIDDDNELFCRLILEINQAGLSWETILKKEKTFRQAYSNFDLKKVAKYSEKDRKRLMSDPGIIRNRLKINAAIENAKTILQLQKEFGSFQNWLAAEHPKTKEEWVKVDDLNILNVVDSWVHPDIYKLLESQRPWDLVLWPFQTMRELEVLSPLRAEAAPDELPDEWIIPLQILNPKFLVPSSCQFVHENWSWYNRALFPISYQKFQLKMKPILPRVEIIRMNPSVSFVLDKENMTSALALDWIIPVGPQDVDYEYSPNLIPPSVQDISKNFKPLAKEESDKVYQYCQFGILEKYRSLPLAEEPYFHVERFWQLTVYDHEGKSFSFFYKIVGTDIEMAKDCDSFVTWWTEVSIFKLYSALFLGESLTSMYLRLNNRFYDLDTEVELQSVEIICDPLIRCLFDGDFGSYQRDQLRRITENLNIKR